jgi:formylglycine-generating enzyme required for sulfatase activity
MTGVALLNPATKTLWPPAMLLLALGGLLAWQTDLVEWPSGLAATMATPATMTIMPRTYSYRAGGDFIRDGAPIDGPLLTVEHPAPIEIMTYQVSAIDYARCVAEAACERAEPRRRGEGNVPVTGVSFRDANDYAAWLSRATGQTWRLPTVAEWAFAAGSKATDHALGVETDPQDPAERWLAFYEKEAALGDNALRAPEPLGAFGVNEYGVADLAGSVWEWTATCGSRTTLAASGEPLRQLESCGVRFLEGRHRTPMNVFVRDAMGGGCSVGVPPDNLGFRLVRERGALDSLLGLFGLV